jgi:excisionase family DNA binding protein
VPRVEIPLARYGLVSVEEAAAIRGVSVRRVQQYVESGRIPVVVAGVGRNRKYLLARADVEAFEPKPPGQPPKVAAAPVSPARAGRTPRKQVARKKSRNP